MRYLILAVIAGCLNLFLSFFAAFGVIALFSVKDANAMRMFYGSMDTSIIIFMIIMSLLIHIYAWLIYILFIRD